MAECYRCGYPSSPMNCPVCLEALVDSGMSREEAKDYLANT